MGTLIPLQSRRRCGRSFLAAAILVMILAFPLFAASIVNSKHNLSSTASGSVKAATESEICIYCHIPHNASPLAPLWSRNETGQIYAPYTSTTSKAVMGQPTGASKLCLSCHDGTVALGLIRSRTDVIHFTGQITPQKNIGVDLSDDHPVSFPYDSSLAFLNPDLKNPSTLTERVRLDRSAQMQCTSCHDPHDDQYGNFLVMDGTNSGLCVQCHYFSGWPAAVHNVSSKTFQGVTGKWRDPKWNTVAQYGCQSCHQLHGAAGKKRLLYFSEEEKNCLSCHDGSAATKNINSEINKISAHRVGSYSRLHDPAERPLQGTPRHVECTDCHNAHYASNQDTAALPGSLRGVKGVSAAGTEIDQITNEYELCFRCHGDTAAGPAAVNRQFAELNTRLEFSPSNLSFHPVEAVGKNRDVPSLIAPMTPNSLIQCSSCHNSNTGPGNGGTGPNGAHGSIYPPLLERQLLVADRLPESSFNYALCYKCHDRGSILSNQSFSMHRNHVQDKRSPCTACHDPHGVKNASHLINFDLNIVSPSSSGRLAYEDLGRFQGRCYLTCHGQDHNPESY